MKNTHTSLWGKGGGLIITCKNSPKSAKNWFLVRCFKKNVTVRV
jgi:hypothetical protein